MLNCSTHCLYPSLKPSYVILLAGNTAASVDSEAYTSKEACEAARVTVTQEYRSMRKTMSLRTFCIQGPTSAIQRIARRSLRVRGLPGNYPALF
jgi:hypothetical protein